MSFEEFQKLLGYIKKYRNPNGFTYEAFGIKGRKVAYVDCRADFNTGKITQIRVGSTAGEEKAFDVSKDLDSWTVQAWLVDNTKS